MATPNINPRADDEGQLGESSKRWSEIAVKDLFVNGNLKDGTNTTTLAALISGGGAIYGSQFQKFESAAISTTTSTSMQTKITDTTTSLPVGTYKITINYNWNYNNTGASFEAEFLLDGSTIDSGSGLIHKQEPKDSTGSLGSTGTDQRHSFTKIFYQTFGTETTHTIDLNYRSSNAGSDASIWDAVIEIIRVS